MPTIAMLKGKAMMWITKTLVPSGTKPAEISGDSNCPHPVVLPAARGSSSHKRGCDLVPLTYKANSHGGDEGDPNGKACFLAHSHRFRRCVARGGLRAS